MFSRVNKCYTFPNSNESRWTSKNIIKHPLPLSVSLSPIRNPFLKQFAKNITQVFLANFLQERAKPKNVQSSTHRCEEQKRNCARGIRQARFKDRFRENFSIDPFYRLSFLRIDGRSVETPLHCFERGVQNLCQECMLCEHCPKWRHPCETRLRGQSFALSTRAANVTTLFDLARA